MNKRGQNIGIGLSLAAVAELVIGISVAVFFIIAANQFVDGNVANKKYFDS